MKNKHWDHSGFINDRIAGVTVYGLEDLLARKLNALKDRAEGKDIFDSYNGLAIADIKKLKKAMPVALEDGSHKLTLEEFIDSISAKLNSVDAKKVQKLTNQYIPVRNRPTSWKIMISTLRDRLETMA